MRGLGRAATAVGLLVISLLGCGADREPSYEETVDEGLSRLLPTADEIPHDLVDGSPRALVREMAGPDAPTNPLSNQLDGRPGRAGFRSFSLLVWPDEDQRMTTIDLELRQHADVDAATSFWEDHPPEVAHADSSMNLDGDPDADPDDWRSSRIERLEPFDWQGICLTGGIDDFPCHGFHGWVRLCQYTMEIGLGTSARPVDDPSVASTMLEIALRTAENLGIDPDTDNSAATCPPPTDPVRTPSAFSDQQQTINEAVRDWVGAVFIFGDAEAAWERLSSRCQSATTRHRFGDQVREDFASDVGGISPRWVTAIEPTDEHGLLVTRRSFEDPDLDVEMEPWVYEDDDWRLDAC